VTERLYYTDSYATEFDATVLDAVAAADGRPAVRLDRTAFYPTSGGQPHDTGMLGAARVLDVVDDDDGILHVLDMDLPRGPTRGRIDWERRFDHMQQHTGQHVLSAAFERITGVPTVSFHLGVETSTIDLARDLTATEIEQAEDEANRVVWADRPVTVRFADAEEAARLPLRKESGRAGTLRLVEVAGVDLSACGGTHVASSGAIGNIAIVSTERVRGGVRIEFVCGRRALRAHRRLRDVVSASVRMLSVAADDLPAAVDRMQAEARDVRRQIKDMQSRLISLEADALAGRAEPLGDALFVVAALEGWDAGGLKQLASTLAARSRLVAVLVSAPPPSSIVVSRAADVSIDSAALLKQVVAKFGGKGGGRPELAQGGGLSGPIDEIVAFARTASASAR
jgi:alanyl-tRNA synthetase